MANEFGKPNHANVARDYDAAVATLKRLPLQYRESAFAEAAAKDLKKAANVFDLRMPNVMERRAALRAKPNVQELLGLKT